MQLDWSRQSVRGELNMLLWWIFSSLCFANAQIPCKTLGATCASCTSINICVSQNSTGVVINCDRPTPYCNAGSCSSIPGGKECSANLTKFLCPPIDGTYPDGSSCRMYHSCLNGTSYEYQCSVGNSVYNAGTESCVRQSQTRPCHQVSCWRSPGPYAVYPGDDSLYFLCVNSKPTLVQRCDKGLRFDQTSQTCVLACTKEGRFADPTGNSTIFVECTSTIGIGGNAYTTITRVCPPNSSFNSSSLRCEIQYNRNVQSAIIKRAA